MPATPVGSEADLGNKTPFVVDITSKAAFALGEIVPMPTLPVELVVPDAAAMLVPFAISDHKEPLMATCSVLVVLL